MSAYKYLKLVKFSHTVFALPFAFIGFFMANETVAEASNVYSWRLLILVVLAMVFARNSAMGFNRYVDRFIDAKNPRTAGREIPAKVISPKSVLFFVVINVLLFITTTAFINNLAFMLSVPALMVIMGYSYVKRFSALCHYVLGLSLAIAPMGAYISITGKFDIAPLILSIIVFLWSSGFDILYSLDDESFDKKEKLHSVPAKYGRTRAMEISSAGHVLIVPLLCFLYLFGDMGALYIAGSVIFVSLLAYQHFIIKPDDISRLNAAFFTSNGVASILFAIFTVWDILVR
ncbi:4-hydroxybenzoate octaprenyltransferase [bioreactor metagenome]|uniref:4-hydroxybenzoate octaprenyltransferase n=1 Tax=bioreactor metagenome TaxID=1076179 RepID=A0A645BPM4_9ZZZZ|nr:UbiA-like polyprenyltransferase [Rikenellaceae bacterium]